MATYKPLPGWIVCRSLQASQVSQSGLVMPGADQTKVREGLSQVLAVGAKFTEEDQQVESLVRVGDTILHREFLREAIVLPVDDGSRVFLLKEEDVWAVVEGPGTIGMYSEYILE